MHPSPSHPPHRTPLIAAGLLLGAGLGGFVDGIVLHQILQWHNMLSGQLPPDSLVRAKVNMYWDGLFHAAVWVLTAIGLALLWQATGRADVPRSGRTLWGGLLLGWGLFNVVEGIIDHEILGLHHVYEYTPNSTRLLERRGPILSARGRVVSPCGPIVSFLVPGVSSRGPIVSSPRPPKWAAFLRSGPLQ